MNLISDEILIDSGQQSATHKPIYPMNEDFRFWDPAAWTKGHPFEAYKRMRQDAPVMWTKTDKNLSGFWSVTKYEDIKAAELAHKVFSSQRGSLTPDGRAYWAENHGRQMCRHAKPQTDRSLQHCGCRCALWPPSVVDHRRCGWRVTIGEFAPALIA